MPDAGLRADGDALAVVDDHAVAQTIYRQANLVPSLDSFLGKGPE